MLQTAKKEKAITLEKINSQFLLKTKTKQKQQQKEKIEISTAIVLQNKLILTFNPRSIDECHNRWFFL